MKTTINAAKLLAIPLLALFTMGNAVTASPVLNPEKPIELKYMGKTDNQPVFQLNFNNPEASEYVISIIDANGKNLYSEKIEGINVTRNYRLDIDEADLASPDFGLTIKVKGLTNNNSEEFHVKSTVHVEQHYEVAKL